MMRMDGSGRGGILFLSLDLFSLGGIQRQSRYELEALRRLLPDIDLVTCSFAGPAASGFASQLDVDIVGGSNSFAGRVAFAARVWAEAQRRQVRLIICEQVNAAPVAYAYHLLTGTPYWINGIEVWGELHPARRLALEHASLILSGSHFTAEYLRGRFPQLASRIDVMGDCVDLDRFTPGPPDPELERALNLPSSLKILTVAALRQDGQDGQGYKGHDVVMEAVARLRRSGLPATYVISGDGPDRQRLERLAYTKGIGKAVVFLGAVDDTQLPGLYRLCDVFVLVSRFRTGAVPEGEGVPLVVLEAQASGRPAVTSHLDGSAESVVDEISGLLVDPFDPGEVADALRQLLEDELLRARMGRAARTFVEISYSFPAFQARIGRLLESRAEWSPRPAVTA
jgi:phosphatidylinositol alpha-1,6-mannosyltransferase